MTFTRVDMGNGNFIYINPKLVRFVLPAKDGRSSIYFDKEHAIAANETAEVLCARLEGKRT